MSRHHLTFALALAFGAVSGASAHEPAGHADTYAAAVAAPDRPEASRELDASRKPAETLTFLGLEPGMTAADLIPGEGYWTELLAHAVGPDGTVVALQPVQFYNDEKSVAEWSALEQRAPGVTLVRYPFDAFAYDADSLDWAIMNLNYHDLYWVSEQYKIPFTDPDAFVAALYAAMKPGGTVGIIDHVGEGADTRSLVDKLHRIDPAVVRADFERGGFEFVGESEILRNPEDDHTANVFDPAIRGKTDRFMFKFRKPVE